MKFFHFFIKVAKFFVIRALKLLYNKFYFFYLLLLFIIFINITEYQNFVSFIYSILILSIFLFNKILSVIIPYNFMIQIINFYNPVIDLFTENLFQFFFFQNTAIFHIFSFFFFYLSKCKFFFYKFIIFIIFFNFFFLFLFSLILQSIFFVYLGKFIFIFFKYSSALVLSLFFSDFLLRLIIWHSFTFSERELIFFKFWHEVVYFYNFFSEITFYRRTIKWKRFKVLRENDLKRAVRGSSFTKLELLTLSSGEDFDPKKLGILKNRKLAPQTIAPWTMLGSRLTTLRKFIGRNLNIDNDDIFFNLKNVRYRVRYIHRKKWLKRQKQRQEILEKWEKQEILIRKYLGEEDEQDAVSSKIYRVKVFFDPTFYEKNSNLKTINPKFRENVENKKVS